MEIRVPGTGGGEPRVEPRPAQADRGLEQPRPETFVLRMTPGAAGGLAGVIQHVRSGERRRFEGLAGLAEAITVMLPSRRA